MANVPEWFPGAGFKRLAREWSGTVEEMASAPLQFAKDQMVTIIYTLLSFYNHALKYEFYRLLASPFRPSLQVYWRVTLCLQRRSTCRSGLLRPCTPAVQTRYPLPIHAELS